MAFICPLDTHILLAITMLSCKIGFLNLKMNFKPILQCLTRQFMLYWLPFTKKKKTQGASVLREFIALGKRTLATGTHQ